MWTANSLDYRNSSNVKATWAALQSFTAGADGGSGRSNSAHLGPVPHKSDDNEAGGEGPPATTALARGGITITPVFSRGEGGCSAYRIPGIQSLNGTLLVFAECRKYDCGDFGGQHNIAFKRSTDGGASFSEVQTLLDPMVMFSAEQCPTDAASVRSQNSSCVFWDPVCYCASRCGSTNSRELTDFALRRIVLRGIDADCGPRDWNNLLVFNALVGSQQLVQLSKPRGFVSGHVALELYRCRAVV